jgi:RND superfamily putative drug exporter
MAVLLDATVVRVLLVPATMALIGERNWYLPKWLDRILPEVHVEGESEEELEAELRELAHEDEAKVH